MLYAILADIHGNYAAFDAVLKDIPQRGDVQELWCLGDLVGYGPEPHECIELLQRTNHLCVAGNHDWGAIGKIDIAAFNPDAATAIRWTAKQLNEEDKTYLKNLPTTLVKNDFTIVHGSPRGPTWEYVISSSIATQNLVFFKTKYCLLGHTHVPVVFKTDEKSGVCISSPLAENVGLMLGKQQLLINPGAVGQPRDGDPRASYALYDTESNSIKLYRVPYDIDATQRKMMKYGLPMRLVARLSHGT
jgi:predicted phosphodiesterase